MTPGKSEADKLDELPEHKPLDAVNRARRVVYTAVSKLRHGLNGASRSEPTGDERF